MLPRRSTVPPWIRMEPARGVSTTPPATLSDTVMVTSPIPFPDIGDTWIHSLGVSTAQVPSA